MTTDLPIQPVVLKEKTLTYAQMIEFLDENFGSEPLQNLVIHNCLITDIPPDMSPFTYTPTTTWFFGRKIKESDLSTVVIDSCIFKAKGQRESVATNNYPYKVELTVCHDCAALPGYEHSDGCDVARCPECGIQRLQCEEHEDSTLPAIWTGIWPGEIECVEYDLWSKWVDGTGWVETTADDPEREPDLNKLASMALQWSVRLQRFVKPDFEEGQHGS